MKTAISVLALSSAALLFAGCSCCKCNDDSKAAGGATAAAAMPMNAVCPVGGKSTAGTGATTTYNGKTVGFCCADCAAEWAAMSTSAKDAALAKVATK